MTRAWAEFLELIDETVGLSLVLVLLLIGSIVLGLLHYYYPRWVPTRLPRLRRKAKKEKKTPEKAVQAQDVTEEVAEVAEELPELPAHVFASLADRLAAEGRYAEAVRERLRAIVRSLVERRSVEVLPGMTVTEVARAASVVIPGVEPPLREATGIFSDIWYGQLPATAEHDERMRRVATEVGV